jgi:hypothetical protein
MPILVLFDMLILRAPHANIEDRHSPGWGFGLNISTACSAVTLGLVSRCGSLLCERQLRFVEQ